MSWWAFFRTVTIFGTPLPASLWPPAANIKVVQRMLGHASAAMTLDIYAGLFDGDLDAVADRLGRGGHS